MTTESDDAQITAGSSGGRWIVWLGLAAVAAFGVRTISHAEFWTHLATGQWIAAHGIPRTDPFSFATLPNQLWINDTWLYDLLTHLMWQAGGAPLITLVHIAAVVIAFALLTPVARRTSGYAAITIALVICAWLLAPRFTVRPMILCFAGPALFIYLLSNTSLTTGRGLALVLAQILWTNLHSSFVFGPVLALSFAVETAARWRRAELGTAEAAALKRQSARLFTLAAILILATLLNPYRTGLYAHLLLVWGNAHLNVLLEWISPFNPFFAPFPGRHVSTLCLIVIAAGFVAFRQRLPLTVTMLGVAAAFLLVRSLRFVDIAALLAFPFMALSLSACGRAAAAGLRWETVGTNRAAWFAKLLAVLVSCLSLTAVISNYYFTASGSASTFGLGLNMDIYPGEACERVISRPDFPRRALNLAHDGGYLAWRLPERKIFTDTRDELFGVPFYQQFAAALQGNTEAWAKLMDLWQPDAVILNCTWPGAGASVRHLVLSDQWRMVYFDGTTAILLRLVSEHLHLIQDADLQTAGLQLIEKERRAYRQRLDDGCRPGNPPRLIGACAIFQAMGQFQKAEAIFELLTRASPSMSSAWLGQGICQFKLDKPESARASLERASRLMPKDPLVWLWLGKTYLTLGQQEASRQAYAKARALSPALYEMFDTGLEARSRDPEPDTLFPPP